MSISTHLLHSTLQRRKMLGIPAMYMARQLGISGPAYHRIEKGERRCYLDYAATIAAILGCTIDALSRDPTVEEMLWMQENAWTKEQRYAVRGRVRAEPEPDEVIVVADTDAQPVTNTDPLASLINAFSDAYDDA